MGNLKKHCSLSGNVGLGRGGIGLSWLFVLLLAAWTPVTAQMSYFQPQVNAVTPRSVSHGPGSYSHDYDVTNTGNAAGTATITVRCKSAVTSCSSLWTSVSLNPFQSTRVTVNYTAPYGGTGAVWLKAVSQSDPSRWSEGKLDVQVNLSYLVADGSPINTTNQDAGLCEASCFTPIYSQGTVPYYTLNAARNITLVYHGDQAAPSSMAYANVSINTGRAVAYYWLEAKRTNGASVTFANGETRLKFVGITSGQIRLGGKIIADANSMVKNGMNPISMLVTSKFTDSTSEIQLIEPQLIAIDARASSVARGWTIAGLQRLYPQTDGNVLITEGDGSGTFFAVDPYCSTCYTNTGGDPSTLSRDGSNNYSRSYPDSTKAQFNSTGQLTALVDRFGNRTGFAYDGSGRLTEVQDPILTYGGSTPKAIVLTYGTYGLASVQNPSTAVAAKSGGRITYFTVASDSTLRVIKDPDGDSTRFGYANRLLQTVTDRRGGVSTYTLDANGRLQFIDSPQVQLWNGLVRPRIGYAGTQMAGVPTSATATTPWTPALTANLVDSVTDALGNKTAFTANRWGQPLQITEPLGRITTINRTGIYPTSVQSPEGAIDYSTFTNGILTSQQLEGEQQVNIRYGGWAQADSIGGTGWPSTRNSLGPGGRVDWSRLGPSDTLRITYTYNSRGQVATEMDSLGHTTIFHYDPVTGNLDSTLSPGSRFTKIAFDAYGRMTTQQSNNEPLRRVVYDSVDRVREVYDSVNATPTRYTYDQLYLTRVQDIKGQVFKFERNALGWITRKYDPADTLNRYDSYTYDSSGNVHSYTNRRGQQLSYTYDVLNRVTSKTGTNTTSDYYEYSSDGLKMVARNAISTDSIFFRKSGWVDSVVTRIGGRRFNRIYRPNNIQQLDSIRIATDAGVTFADRHYGWNRETGELDTVTVNNQTTRFVRNKDLLPRQTVWPAVTRTEQWTAIHRPGEQAFSVPAIDSAFYRAYSFDSRFLLRDNIQKEAGNFRTQQRGYDFLRRVHDQGNNLYAPSNCPWDANSGFVCSSLTFQSSYTFDAVGNRTDFGGSYATGNRIQSFKGYTFQHDLDGNVTQKYNTSTGETKTFEWSAEGLLTRVLINGVERVKYDYDAEGQLVRRWTDGVLDRHFLWDQNHLLAELDGSASQRVAEYAYLPGEDQPFAIMTGASTITLQRYQVLDEVGNVIGVTNGTGTGVDQRTSYDDWGVPSTTGSADNRLLFKGLLWEGTSAGLYYMRARWYDPELGRFLSEDPIGIAGGINQYAFAAGDPVNGSDPSGEKFKWKSLLGPVVALAAITIGGATGPIGAAAAFSGGFHALAAAAFGSAAAAGVESVFSREPFGRIFLRNFSAAGWILAAEATGAAIPGIGGHLVAVGQHARLQGFVESSKVMLWDRLAGALTLGPVTVFNGIGQVFPVRTYPAAIARVHEFGHTFQFIFGSAWAPKVPAWASNIGLGILGMTSAGHWWENMASSFGRPFVH